MRNKRMNSFMALLLAVIMALGQPVTVFAEEGVTVSTEVTEESTIEETVVEETATEEATTEEDATEEATTEEVATEEATTEEVATEETTTEEATTEEVATEETTTEEATTEEATTEEVATEVAETETTEESMEVAGDNALAKELKSFGFKTMDLSSEMMEEKADYAEVASSMSTMESGKDYIENEIVYFADSEEEAEQIADCYGGTVTEFEYGVAVAKIEAKVADAVKFAANPKAAIPAIYPNIVYSICDDGDLVNAEAETEEVQLVDEADVVREELPEENNEELVLPSDDEQLYATAPNDTYFGSQWHHENMNTIEAWNATKGAGVTVAVIDTGIDYEHPDLKQNIVGYTTTINDYTNDGRDDNGHGTHCAGIIAAVAGNAIGVSGIAPEASIYSVKVLAYNGYGNTDDIIQGVIAATNYNVDVISMSLGSIVWDKLYQRAIDNAAQKGIVVVAAAGNEATSQKSYPAAYNNVIAVAATDQYDTLTDFSNYGKWVDIAAPGLNILSTLPTNFTVNGVNYENKGYGYMSGTSMACPAVAGSVALMIGNNESLKNSKNKSDVAKITKTLVNSAVPDGAMSYYYWWDDDPNWTYPLVDTEATVYAVDENVAEMPTITFSTTPDSKNVVLAGANQYFELNTTTPHSKIYYTLNGKKPTASTGYLYTGKIYMPKSGKVKIQAVTVVGSKTSNVLSKTYTFDTKAESLSSACGDKMSVAIGKSIQLSVDIAPSYTRNKKLEWTSSDSTNMIKVDKNGKVTCNKKATAGATATITAKTTDGSNLVYTFTVEAVTQKADKLTLNAETLNMSYYANSADYNVTMPGYVSNFQLVPTSTGTDVKQYIYKSSNTKVATVDANGNVVAAGTGTAKITVTANDGSGKKAVCKVTVVTPVFDIYMYSSTGFSQYSDYIPIGTGYSIKLNTEVNYDSSYYMYKPSNKNLEWKSDSSYVTVKNGKVTCKKNAPHGTVVTITATAKDGFGTSQSVKFKVTDGITKIGTKDKYGKIKTSQTVKLIRGRGINDVALYAVTRGNTGNMYGSVSVSTTNKDVVYRCYEYDYGQFIIWGTKPGSSKIIYTARDGSNKKFTLNVKVVD